MSAAHAEVYPPTVGDVGNVVQNYQPQINFDFINFDFADNNNIVIEQRNAESVILPVNEYCIGVYASKNLQFKERCRHEYIGHIGFKERCRCSFDNWYKNSSGQYNIHNELS
jgi:hypothetical protein